MDQNASAPATRPAPPAAAAADASDDDEDVESASENSGDELQQHNVPTTKRDDVSDKSPGLPDNYNNNQDDVYGAVIMVQSHCESSPSLFDECRLTAGWLPTLRPSHTTWAVSLLT